MANVARAVQAAGRAVKGVEEAGELASKGRFIRTRSPREISKGISMGRARPAARPTPVVATARTPTVAQPTARSPEEVGGKLAENINTLTPGIRDETIDLVRRFRGNPERVTNILRNRGVFLKENSAYFILPMPNGISLN